MRPAHRRLPVPVVHEADGPVPRLARARPIDVVLSPGEALFLPPQWAHATVSLEPSLSVGAFLQDARALGLHMQLLHAPRGIGTLQDAAVRDEGWYALVARAFEAP